MKAALEFPGFLAAAVIVHVGVLGGTNLAAPAAQGGDGEASVMLVASTGSLSDLVSEWSKPPDIQETVEMAAAPSVDAPELPAAVSLTAPTFAAPVLPLDAAPQESLPQVDLTVPEPPVTQSAPLVSLRPQDRPDRRATQPAPAATPRAPSIPRETAAGAGQSPTAGTVERAPPAAAPAPAPSTSPAALSQWGSAIRSSIERRKRYPSGTRARGTVTLAISISTNGALVSVSVVGSSGDALLDRAGATAVQRAQFPAAPNGVAPGTHQFTLPMSFAP